MQKMEHICHRKITADFFIRGPIS